MRIVTMESPIWDSKPRGIPNELQLSSADPAITVQPEMLPQSLKGVLSAYPPRYAPHRCDPLGTAGGFSGARIYRLETDAGPFCLRGWPANSLPLERIAGLHRLLRHVFEGGVDVVSVPVTSRSGETLVMRNNQAWQLEPWMPGQADYCENSNRNRMKATMTCLAKFHQATQNYEDVGPARQWFYQQDQAPSPAVAERLAILQEWKSEKIARLAELLTFVQNVELRQLGAAFAGLFERVARFVENQLEILSRASFRLQPCLRDVWHDHVLFTGDEVSGLIDPSACRCENIACDLARLLGSLVRDDRDAWEFAIREYERHRSLEVQEMALVQVLDQSGVLLSGMNWLDRLVLRKEVVPNLPNVLDRLKILQRRLECLNETIRGTSSFQ